MIYYRRTPIAHTQTGHIDESRFQIIIIIAFHSPSQAVVHRGSLTVDCRNILDSGIHLTECADFKS